MSRISRRGILRAAGAAAIGAAAGSLLGFNILQRRRKNVIFVMSDALRADRLGCYGYKSSLVRYGDALSPSIDRLAAHGALFERCIAPSSWTLPSVAAIMSSRLPFVEGTTYNEGFAPPERATLAEALHAAGYHTIAFVGNPWLSYGKPDAPVKPPVMRGFDEWHVVSTEMVANPMIARRIGTPMVYERFVSARDVARRLMTALRGRRAWDKPFFIYVHLMDTHEPYNPPEPYKEGCLVPRSRRAPDFMLYQFIRSLAGVIKRNEIREKDQDMFMRARALYDASVRVVDDGLGMLVAGLRAKAIDSETLIAVSSDHGEEFAEHKWIGHSSTLYEESLHVPLIFRGPGVARGARFSDPISSLDVAPTILAACGVAVPAGMVGRPLDLSGGREQDPLVTVSALVKPCEPGELTEKVFAVSDPRGMKMVRHEFVGAKEGAPPVDELYDRRRDPWETSDISASSAAAVAALGRQLRSLRDTHKAAAGRGITIDEETRQRLKALGYLGG